MPFQIIRSDITKVSADAIVNTANPRPVIGGGTDSAIYKAAGADLLMAERQKIGDIARGDAVSTPAFDLNAKYIIHTVGPRWTGGDQGERDILRSCYKKSLALADELNCESIAFPLLSTGSYEYPRDEALDIAITEIRRFLQDHEMDVTLVVFDSQSFQLSKELTTDINEYIDEHYVRSRTAEEYYRPLKSPGRRSPGDRFRDLFSQKSSRSKPEELSEALYDSIEAEGVEFDMEDNIPLPTGLFDADKSFPILPKEDRMEKRSAPVSANRAPSAGKKSRELSLSDIFEVKEDTFQQRLFKLIDERGLKDPTVYKRANMDRKTFSKIRCDEDYQPKKKTAMALCIALKLDMPATKDLLSRAGFAISPSSKADLIVSYFIENEDFDIDKINMALFNYHLDKDLLGYK